MRSPSMKSARVDNIYRLDGLVPIGKAIPFGLQHVLAMFVANVTPVVLIASVAKYQGVAFSEVDAARLVAEFDRRGRVCRLNADVSAAAEACESEKH